MRHNRVSLTLLGVLVSASAHALDWRISLGAGLGTSKITVGKVTVTESPVAFKFGIEMPLSYDKTLAIEHARSFQLSPTASGITLTSVAGLWFPWGSYPQRMLSVDETVRNSWTQKRIAPFVGFGTGFATGDATQLTNGRAVVISGYAFAISLRGGADYPLSDRLILRSLVEFNTGFMGTAIRSTALHFGALWYL